MCSAVQLFATALLLPIIERRLEGASTACATPRQQPDQSKQNTSNQPELQLPASHLFILAGAFPVLSSWIDYNDFLPFARITNRHAPWSSPLTFRTSSRRGTLQHPGPRAQSRMPSPPDNQVPRLHVFAGNHPRSSKLVPTPNLRRLIPRPISRPTNNPRGRIPLTRRRVRQGSARRHLLLKMRKTHSRESMGHTMSRTQRTNLRPGEKLTRLH